MLATSSSALSEEVAMDASALSQAVFGACEPRRGCELWITDGTRPGTTVLRNIMPGALGSNPTNMTQLGDGRVLFSAQSTRTLHANDFHPWITDGTRGGTRLIRHTSDLTIDMHPQNFTPLGDGRAVFVARGSGGSTIDLTLWVTGGDRSSTRPIAALDNWAALFTSLGSGLAIFRHIDEAGTEMWVTDGSRRGTKVLRDINSGPASSNPNAAAAFGDGRALFNADDGVNGRELWVTDGTRRGTRMVADLQPGTMSSDPQMFTPIGGGRALFTASLHGIGTRIWVTDGTADGTRMLSHALNPVSMTHLGDGRVLFPAYVNSAIGTQLHITDGTDEGTRIVRQIDQPGGLDFRHFRPLGDGRAVFWQVRGVTPYELWVTDGTRAGTRRVGDSGTLQINSLSEIWSLMDGRAIFTRQDHRGNEPWITDGTRSATGLLQDINRGAAHSRARGFTVVEGMQD